MSGGAIVTIRQGYVRVVPHDADTVKLADINEHVGSPFGVFMTQRVTEVRRLDWLCHDEALLRYDSLREEVHRSQMRGHVHEWALSFVRPTDGSPIAGPLMVCALDYATGESLPLTHEEAARVYDSLVAIGFRPE